MKVSSITTTRRERSSCLTATATAVIPTMPMYSTLFGKQYSNSAANTDCSANTSASSNFTTVSGRSYTSKYRTVSSPLFLLHPVTSYSVDVCSCVHRGGNAFAVHVLTVGKCGFKLSVSLRRTAIICIAAHQIRAIHFVIAECHALLDYVLARSVNVR